MNDDTLVFVDEKPKSSDTYQVLIVDDNREIHSSLKMLLSEFSFLGKSLAFHSAFSAGEGREKLNAMSYAVVILDVIMETKSAGLDFVGDIRRVSEVTRIIIHTGQPGDFPEPEVIEKYDINNYVQKSEPGRLLNVMNLALREYSSLCEIQRSYEEIKSYEARIKRELSEFREFFTNAAHYAKDSDRIALEMRSNADRGSFTLKFLGKSNVPEHLTSKTFDILLSGLSFNKPHSGLRDYRTVADKVARQIVAQIAQDTSSDEITKRRLIMLRDQTIGAEKEMSFYLSILPYEQEQLCRKLLPSLPTKEELGLEKDAGIYLEEMGKESDPAKLKKLATSLNMICSKHPQLSYEKMIESLPESIRTKLK